MGAEDHRYDAIVAGAGPGGASAAFFLGAAGLNVLVLEKQRLPRYKPCGGGLSARLLDEFPFSFEPVIESRICEVRYALRDQDHISIPLPDKPIYMVMRDSFDAYILSNARAEVRSGEQVCSIEEREDRVIVTTKSGEVFETNYLIGADGANSVVARLSGLHRRRRLPGAIEVEVKPPPEVFKHYRDRPVFIFGEIDMGYLWIFPKGNHLSVGIGALKPRPKQLQETLERVMKRYGITLDGAIPYDGALKHGHPLPVFVTPRKIATRRILLVGDAAGLMDPLTGEGIRFAVKSGKLAAEAIITGQTRKYAGRVFWKIGFSHMFAVPLSLVFYTFPGLCFYLGVCKPYATRAFVDLLAGKTTYPSVIIRLFATLPLYAIKVFSMLLSPRHQSG